MNSNSFSVLQNIESTEFSKNSNPDKAPIKSKKNKKVDLYKQFAKQDLNASVYKSKIKEQNAILNNKIIDNYKYFITRHILWFVSKDNEFHNRVINAAVINSLPDNLISNNKIKPANVDKDIYLLDNLNANHYEKIKEIKQKRIQWASEAMIELIKDDLYYLMAQDLRSFGNKQIFINDLNKFIIKYNKLYTLKYVNLKPDYFQREFNIIIAKDDMCSHLNDVFKPFKRPNCEEEYLSIIEDYSDQMFNSPIAIKYKLSYLVVNNIVVYVFGLLLKNKEYIPRSFSFVECPMYSFDRLMNDVLNKVSYGSGNKKFQDVRITFIKKVYQHMIIVKHMSIDYNKVHNVIMSL